MATVFDTKFVPLAKRLLAKYGTNATFVDTVFNDYDPNTGIGELGNTPEYTVKVTPPEVKTTLDSLSQTVEVVTLFYAAAADVTFTPRKGMRILFQDTEYAILDFNEIFSGGQRALWAFVCRK